MTLKEFKNKFKDLPDDTPIAVVLSDGNLDYACFAYESKDDLGKVIVVSPN